MQYSRFSVLNYYYTFFQFFYNNHANKQKRIKDGYKIKTIHPLFSGILYMLTDIHVENVIHYCGGKIGSF